MVHFNVKRAILFVTVFTVIACDRNKEPLPEILSGTTVISDIFDNEATAASDFVDHIPGKLIQYGHVWSSAGLPSISDSRTELAVGGQGVPDQFKSRISKLSPGTTYQVRPYVRTSGGVVYGGMQRFTTETDYIKRLVKIIDDSLKGKGFGYSFAVSKRGLVVGSGAGGFLSRSIEMAGEKALTQDSRMQIASMTKTITAVAFIKIAKERGINLTDHIAKYLPPAWKQGGGISQITFRDLLKHQSGIIGLGSYCLNGSYVENYWFGLKNLIAKGVKTENYGNQCYQNSNYGMFRVLIPALMGYKFTGDDAIDDEQTQRMYESYVQDNIMKKTGVTSGELLNNLADSPSFGYEHPYTTGSYGFNPGIFGAVVGGYGYYLSANEAGGLYAKIFSSDDQSVITTALKDSILSNGIANYSAITPQGQFWYHDGWWYSNFGNGLFKGFRSVWMKCPDDITVVLFTNSLRHGDGLFPIRSDHYSDVASYVLWAFSELYNEKRNARLDTPVDYQKYLSDPQPH